MSKTIKQMAQMAKQMSAKQLTEKMRDIIYSKNKISKDQFAELKKVVAVKSNQESGSAISVPVPKVEKPNDSGKAYAGFKERAQELDEKRSKSSREQIEFQALLKP